MEKMSERTYRLWKVLIVLVLAGVTGTFVSQGDFVIPLAMMAVAVFLLLALAKKRRVPRSDERVMAIGGKAALWTFTIFAVGSSVAGVVLTALSDRHAELLAFGMVFSYLTCGMVFCYTLLYWYFNRKM